MSDGSTLKFQSFTNESFDDVSTAPRGRIGDPPKSSNPSSTATTGTTSAKDLLSLSTYAAYFDVDSDQVLSRILASFNPRAGASQSADVTTLPDLYGPFWICTTLVFTTAICGNLARFVESSGAVRFESDFSFVTGATSLISAYVLLVPFVLYVLSWYLAAAAVPVSYVSLVAVYGYALSIFVPVSVLWTVDVALFRWILIAAAVAVSGVALARAVQPLFSRSAGSSTAVMALALALHLGLAIALKVYFFDVAHVATSAAAVVPQEQPKPEAPKVPELPVPVPVAGNVTANETAPVAAAQVLTKKNLPDENNAKNIKLSAGDQKQSKTSVVESNEEAELNNNDEEKAQGTASSATTAAAAAANDKKEEQKPQRTS